MLAADWRLIDRVVLNWLSRAFASAGSTSLGDLSHLRNQPLDNNWSCLRLTAQLKAESF